MAVPQKNIMTVKGESVVLHCLFKGNLKILWPSMSIYWMIGSHGQHTEPTYIMDNSTDPYRIAVYQTCLSEDGSCCNFTNQLNIKSVPLELNGADLTCGIVLDEVSSSHSAKLCKYIFITNYNLHILLVSWRLKYFIIVGKVCLLDVQFPMAGIVPTATK